MMMAVGTRGLGGGTVDSCGLNELFSYFKPYVGSRFLNILRGSVVDLGYRVDTGLWG